MSKEIYLKLIIFVTISALGTNLRNSKTVTCCLSWDCRQPCACLLGPLRWHPHHQDQQPVRYLPNISNGICMNRIICNIGTLCHLLIHATWITIWFQGACFLMRRVMRCWSFGLLLWTTGWRTTCGLGWTCLSLPCWNCRTLPGLSPAPPWCGSSPNGCFTPTVPVGSITAIGWLCQTRGSEEYLRQYSLY